jgi:tetratricopeptide (TPR) repeat protein
MAAAIVSIRGAAERAEAERAIAVQARSEAESAMRIANQQRDRAEQMRAMAEAKSTEANEERVLAGKHLETQRQFANAVTSLLDYEMLARNPESIKIIDAWLEAQKQAVKQDPSNRNAQKLLGILHNRRGTQLFKRSPRSAEPDCVASVEILTRVTEAEPEDDWTRRNLMISLGQLGQVYAATLRSKQAIPVLQRAVELSARFRSYDPVFYLDQLASRSALADAFFASGQLEEGAKVQEEAYQVWARRPAGAVLKGPTAYLLPISMQRMARATRLKNPQRAAELMGRALGIMRELAESKNAGYLEFNEYANALNTCEWEELRRPDAALHYARKAVELTPKETRHLALDTLAWALYRKGDTAAAIASSREAISLLPAGFSMERLVLEKSLKTFQDGSSAALK